MCKKLIEFACGVSRESVINTILIVVRFVAGSRSLWATYVDFINLKNYYPKPGLRYFDIYNKDIQIILEYISFKLAENFMES